MGSEYILDSGLQLVCLPFVFLVFVHIYRCLWEFLAGREFRSLGLV